MMNKIKLLVILSIAILITGCGKTQVKTCLLETKEISSGYKLDTKYEIYAKGKDLKKTVVTETITAESKRNLSLFEENLKKNSESLNELYGGYTNKISIKENKLVSTTTLNYKKMDIKKYIEDNSVLKKYVDDKLTVEGLEKYYESLGATCN